MMKIAILKRNNLLRTKRSYALFRGEREIGQLIGTDDEVEIGLDGKTWRIERTRSGIRTGKLSGIRNFLGRNQTGEFRLLDSAGAVLATARQPNLYEFYLSAGPVTLNVSGGKGQKPAKLHVMNERGEAVGDLSQGAWKLTGRTDWFSSLPDTVDPVIEAFLLWLYTLCEKLTDDSTSYSS